MKYTYDMENFKEKYENWDDLLIGVLQKEINRQCCVPEGYNADIEFKDMDDLTIVGITVTDKDGNQVGGVFKDEREVREFFAKDEPYVSNDTLADVYVNGVKSAGNEPSWDIVHTAFCAGMAAERERSENLDKYLKK